VIILSSMNKFLLRFIFLSILITLLSLYAASEETYINANRSYAEENFEQALGLYLELEEEGVESADLFYNIGNAYYRLSKIGRSIQYYRKALRLNPWDGDIKNNLKFAEEGIIDKIEMSTENRVKAIIFFWYYFFNLRMLAIFTAIFSVCMWTFLIIRLYKRKEFISWSFYLFFILTLVFSISTGIKYYANKALKSGVVIAREIPVRSSANERGVVLFNLHEGTSVKIKDTLGAFYRIELRDSKGGWVNKNFIGVI